MTREEMMRSDLDTAMTAAWLLAVPLSLLITVLAAAIILM
jgi:hypothetical protein